MTTAFSRRVLAKTGALDFDAGVERDASGDVVAFRLFKAGRFETDHGVSVFDDTAAKTVLDDRARRANRFALDYDHLSLRDDATPEQRRAAGSFDIELRGGELWAVSLRLTTEAAKMLREGAILSCSPAWNQDPSTGRVISLINAALTNNPATHGATRIAATRPDTMPVRASALDPRLEALRATYGLGASRPLVRNEGCRQVFDYPDPERLRAHARVIASRPAPKFLTPEGRAMHARMVQASRTIRNEGVHQVLPVPTPEEARAVLARKGQR